jgi:phage shock protein C
MTTSANPPYKQLRRTTDDKIIAGVCGGLGRYFGVDPVLMRVIFAVTVVLTGGLALLAYPVLWFLMPEEPTAAAWHGGGASANWQTQTRGASSYQPPTYQGPANPDPYQAPYQAPTDQPPTPPAAGPGNQDDDPTRS